MATITQTENGANAYSSTGKDIVDFFMMFVRGLSDSTMDEYMKKCWQVSPQKTMAIIMNGRDRAEGKKEKNVSNRAMIWLKRKKNATYKLNILNYVNKYGCWKDISYIAIKNINHNDYEVDMFADQLRLDKDLLDADKPVSLCAKWAPSERDKVDKKIHMASRIAVKLAPESSKALEVYRKEFLVPLRKQINIVESYMTSNRWTEIKYDQVPAVASTRLRAAFMKHDPDGYAKYLEQVRSGEKKINVTGILPHELVNKYLQNNHAEPDETIELQWKTIIDKILSEGCLKNTIAVVDVSGSMYDKLKTASNLRPIDVSIALGLLISLCNSSHHFKNKMISFSDHPVVYEVSGSTLCDQVNNLLHKMPHGYNTNMEGVFDLLINAGKMFNIAPEDMPEKIVLLSDMKFDEASSSENKITEDTLHETIIKKYEGTPYTPPKVIYWNLQSDNDNIFPVRAISENVAMVSGFSEQLLKVFMKNDSLNPEAIVEEILSKYLDNIQIHPDDIESVDAVDDDTEPCIERSKSI